MAGGGRPDVAIVGGGIFGATAAVELRERGATVLLVDRGPLPHVSGSSTDLSKLVRADYGNDELYASLMFEALRGWRQLNAWAQDELFHETGVLILSPEPMAEGGFEHASFELLTRKARALERLDDAAIRAAFPAWGEGAYRDGYVSVEGGWAESTRVVRAYLERARALGAVIRETNGIRPIEADQTAPFLVTHDGERLEAGHIVVAAGPLTPVVVPELADRLTPIAQSVLYFVPPSPERFSHPQFLPWAADIARTGWYGFPCHEGVVKVANHGPGRVVDPAAPRFVPPGTEENFRAFFSRALPELATAKLGRSHVCLYCDSADGDFFIDRHPQRPWLTVAAGGSGHAFKFAPLLGRWTADVALGSRPPVPRFRWREPAARRYEDARCIDPK
jgi:glycine/D-amino acid oxidase-like deaminating enzyme